MIIKAYSPSRSMSDFLGLLMLWLDTPYQAALSPKARAKLAAAIAIAEDGG